MTRQADLDVVLHWRGEDAFDLTVLYNAPSDIEDCHYFSDEPIHIDLTRLDERKDDTGEYGRCLGDLLFGGRAADCLNRAVRAGRSMPVHLRLLVDPRAPLGYQAIAWETARQPGTGAWITTSPGIRFCRFQNSPEGMGLAPLARRGDLRALVAVANPSDIADYTAGPAAPLTAIDVDGEIERARRALGNMTVSVLPDNSARLTRGTLVESLRLSEFNLLYLVCHGELGETGPVLFLENERGAVDEVDGAELARQIGELTHVPTLAVLCSCQSGGPADDVLTSSAQSLTAFGPALSQAGAAVVVAMQGNISMDSAAGFLPVFFAELDKDGIAARAMAVARSKISTSPDWYMPVLYSRLKRGSAWYLPRFGGREQQIFSDLHTRIAAKHCTPIVGSGVAAEDGILPTRQKCAQEWIKRRQMPIMKSSQSDLASVSQYVSVDADPGLARDELARFLRSFLTEAHSHDLPELDWAEGDLHGLVRAVGAQRRQHSGGKDCYSRLAALDLPVFVTTSWTKLLEDALTEAGKQPVEQHFRWYQERSPGPPEEGMFSRQRPLVYHLFGTLDDAQSLVLTEDDYFAWLRSWIQRVDLRDHIPDYVKPPMIGHSLVFLGYLFDDWEFRMVFQAIKSFAAQGALRSNSHIGVQLEPETLRVDRDAAQEYLESYLGGDKLSVYWATCDQFLAELEETKPDAG